MAISCDSSGDEYYMTNRVFDFTSGSEGKKRSVPVMLICSICLKRETLKTFRAVVVLYFDYNDNFKP